MKEKLKELQEFVNKMKSTSSLLEKKDIIKSIKGDTFIENALYYTYNPYLKYYMTSKTCKKRTDLIDNDLDYPLFPLLDALIDREYTGHNAIALVNGFVVKNIQYRNLIYSIIE